MRLCHIYVLAGLFLLVKNTIVFQEYQIIEQSLEDILQWQAFSILKISIILLMIHVREVEHTFQKCLPASSIEY